MTRRAKPAHPVDELGRLLPHPGWPAERRAPGALELVRRFCNSLVRESGADRFATAEGFDTWLASEGREPTRPDAYELAAIAAFRDAVHAITVANHRGGPAVAAWNAIVGILSGTRFELRAGDGVADLVPVAPSATHAFLGELAIICVRAERDGTLRRLKSCTNCEWTIYDASKNRSARWCSMDVCGGRHNAREYRRRKRASGR